MYDLFGVSVHIIVTQDHITLKGIDAFIGIVLETCETDVKRFASINLFVDVAV